MTKILIVDDDPHLRELVSVVLRQEGLAAVTAEDGATALELLARERMDLAVVDVMMPRMDGWELVARLRGNGDELPILMLTAKGETSDKVRGFRLGVDDYLVKPFEAEELAARVKALLKRYRISVSQQVQAGRLRMDSRTHEAAVGGVPVTLPLKEFELLYKLAANAGRTLPRDKLIEDIWGVDFEGNERTLDVHVNRLRDRFAEEEAGFRIRTIRGLGYRLEVTIS
ncbi:response regulator transcription factor [Paenibacillus chartarius]|uniref:Heme response regulator HssR n=1 Tax=Paenibacillus chartarius TaxID=747481 RepID=A0ABV6DEI1_9BACL